MRELEHPALLDYLRERKINTGIARRYCKEVHYRTGGGQYFAIGFQNDAGGWELRNRKFKGGTAPKHITTIDNGSRAAMVFEGFSDFLSYLSLKNNPEPAIVTTVLNSVVNLPQAIPFLSRHRTVHAFLDNDETGRKTFEQMRRDLPGCDLVDQSHFYRNHKDVNAYLIARPSFVQLSQPTEKKHGNHPKR